MQRRFWEKTYLYKVYRINKGLFCIFSLFFGLTLLANWAGDEVTPFFVFGMYSQKEEQRKEYEVVQIVLNDSINLAREDFSIYNKTFVKLPLHYYRAIRENNNIDPTITFLQGKLKSHYNLLKPLESRLFNGPKQLGSFMPWYSTYLESRTGKPISAISIAIHYVHYTPDQQVVLDSTHTFERWKKQTHTN